MEASYKVPDGVKIEHGEVSNEKWGDPVRTSASMKRD